MALLADYRQIKGYKSRCYREIGAGHVLKPITRTLVFSTMTIFMDRITEANWKEFYGRLAAWEQAFGGMTVFPDKRYKHGYRLQRITHKDVRDHIGLTVNVAPKSDAFFYRSLVKAIRREVGHV